MRFLPFACAMLAAGAFAQQVAERPAATPAGAASGPAAAPPEQSVATDWDVRSQIGAIAEQVRRLSQIVDMAKPEEWVQKGAPEAYVRQLKATQALMANLVGASQRSARDPGRLSAALDTYFLMADIQQTATSLAEGLRKYQSPTTADRLSHELANTANNRDKLRAHIADLAKTREQELQIMNEEAQRCRTVISRQAEPQAPARRSRARTVKP